MPTVACQRCTKEFYAKPNHLRMGYGKYCSLHCSSESLKKGKFITCTICGNEAWRKPRELKLSKSGLYFCNKSRQTTWRNTYFSGERHPLWVDGASTYRDVMRRTGEIEICRLCRTKDTRILIVHHIDKNRKNNKKENLAWLCHNCHFLVHHDDGEYKKFMVTIV